MAARKRRSARAIARKGVNVATRVESALDETVTAGLLGAAAFGWAMQPDAQGKPNLSIPTPDGLDPAATVAIAAYLLGRTQSGKMKRRLMGVTCSLGGHAIIGRMAKPKAGPAGAQVQGGGAAVAGEL